MDVHLPIPSFIQLKKRGEDNSQIPINILYKMGGSNPVLK
jgi:hypothetical protein